jgi:indolepyruvate ferredoxin oxidoreductase beta subunit
MELKQTRPVTILIAALGGEGGGVLADWLIDAANQHDFPVQSTSVPGVAQRTGATTYYIEIFPVPSNNLAGAAPVMALTPTPGDVNVAVASELVEAGRLIQNGFINPQRTTLIASSHREYAVIEKMAMADGRYDGNKIISAAQTFAQRLILADLRAIALHHGTIINTVMFGAMVGAGALPVSRAACEQAIRNAGKAVDTSLKGFTAGYSLATERIPFTSSSPAVEAGMSTSSMPPRVQALPEPVRSVAVEGTAQVADYQDRAYAEQYLDRIERICDMERDAGGGPGGYRVTCETARYLALWMCYEDVIRVADLKTRRSRLNAVRSEVGAGADEPLRLTEYMKPGLDELCSVLPAMLADRIRKRFAGRRQSLHVGLHIRTDTVAGFSLLSFLRSLRIFRRRTSRYTLEQALIERWLDAVRLSLSHSVNLAYELALCGNLVKGYGETSERGHSNLKLILADVERDATAADLSQRVKRAREAALADPEGRSLAASLGLPPPQMVAKPIRFVRPDSMKSRYEKAL